MSDTSKEAVERFATYVEAGFRFPSPDDRAALAATLWVLVAERDEWRATAERATALAERLSDFSAGLLGQPDNSAYEARLDKLFPISRRAERERSEGRDGAHG